MVDESENVTLADVEPGTVCRVKRLRSQGGIKQRLIDMGLIPSVRVTVIRSAPLNDPIEIQIDDYFVTLRREEARGIEVAVNAEG